MSTERRILECELLVARWRRGERGVFAEIVRMWEGPLFYYVKRLVRSEADAWDVLQETWMKALRAMESIREARVLPAFLYATARNAAITRLRRRGEVLIDPGNVEEVSAAEADEGESAAMEDAEEVHRALDQLPAAQREAVTLYFLRDLSIGEIACVLGVAEGTVKSRLHYGKQALKQIISEGDGHVG